MSDPSFNANRAGLQRALDALLDPGETADLSIFDTQFPEQGLGEHQVLDSLAPVIVNGAQHLGSASAFAHMDPPTPWITWAATLWNAALNQNLLHPDLSPVAQRAEEQVIRWLVPYFGMSGGHMTPGSTVSNLTALWAARELKGITQVIASESAHLSIAKSAHLLGLAFHRVPVNAHGEIDGEQLPDKLDKAALVLTAGSTSAGAIDSLNLAGLAAWTHVDAAWAGPLRLSDQYSNRLAGIEKADSVAVSAHKWLFQPKEAGLILFRDVDSAHQAVSFGGAYLTTPNVGVLGSRSANAVPLLATLMAWGREGVEARISATMLAADQLHVYLDSHPAATLYAPNRCGVILWRCSGVDETRRACQGLPSGMASLTTIGGSDWVRHVAANPNVDVQQVICEISMLLK